MKRICKGIVAILLVGLMCSVANADYQGVTEMDLNLRDTNGEVIDVIPSGEIVTVKGNFNETRVNVEWNEMEGNVWNKIIETAPKAITISELNLRDANGKIIKLIPAGKMVNIVQEEAKDNERTLVDFDGDIGTVITSGIKNDFIYVSIEKQRLSMYKDNNILCYGPTVTGKATDPDRATPTGVFEINYKERNRYLRGPGYKSYVHYWMPIYGGVGIHDADGWRSEYGGDIYLNNGSHGCINIPLSLAKKVYNNSYEGMTVVVSSS